MKTLLFAPEAINLAEVTRTLEIAKVARRSFRCAFLSYDGARRHTPMVEGAGFEVFHLAPPMHDEDVRRFWAVDRGERFGAIIPEDKVAERVRAELALYDRLDVAAVVTGFCLSTAVSARVARRPLVWIAQTTWLREYAERYATWPDALDLPALRTLPSTALDAAARRLLPPLARWLARPFSAVAARYGLPRFRGYDIFEGEHTLFAEPDDFSGLAVPARLHGRHAFIGPLIARIEAPVPEPLLRRDTARPLVYFAMGSSGVEATVARLVEGFSGAPYDVIAPIAPLVRHARLRVPDNVIVSDWLPAHVVNPMARVSVLHGGIGTVLTACLAGTPIVGIPNGLIEQEHNLDCVVRKGFAVRLRHRRADPATVRAAVERALGDDAARDRAQRYAHALAAWDGPERAARYLEAHFASR